MKQELIDYVEKLKAKGFKVYASTSKDESFNNYIYFEDEKGNLGYCQLDRLEGFCFSTVHKPNRQTGTGFSIHRGIGMPTIQHAIDTFVVAPHWGNTSSVKKYKNWEDKQTKETVLKFKQL